jgi:hypothetical protein
MIILPIILYNCGTLSLAMGKNIKYKCVSAEERSSRRMEKLPKKELYTVHPVFFREST